MRLGRKGRGEHHAPSDKGGYAMTGWTHNDLERIGTAVHLQLATFKKDGTLRKPLTIWVVRVGDELYVRAYRGRETAWFQHTQRQSEGHIEAGGVAKDVTLVDTSSDKALNNQIDAAYQSKYRRYSATYVDPMIAPQARATTLKLVPSA
jgi:hypothetical protein